MYDKYLICEEGFRNVPAGGEVTGFELLVRITYYRGIRVSMVEGFDVTVDDQSFPREDNIFTVGGRRYTFAEMEQEPEGRWEFGEKAKLFVPKPGGLAPGDHRISVQEHLRISYMPIPIVGSDTKTLTLNA